MRQSTDRGGNNAPRLSYERIDEDRVQVNVQGPCGRVVIPGVAFVVELSSPNPIIDIPKPLGADAVMAIAAYTQSRRWEVKPIRE